MFIKHTLAAMAMIGSVFGAHPAAAQDRSSDQDLETFSVHVAFGDLNLNNEAGAKAMLHRIRYASRVVCGQAYDQVLDAGGQFRACTDAATDRAITTLGAPLVTALYSGKPDAAHAVLVAAAH